MDGLSILTDKAIADAVARSGRPATGIVAVAATAHGDGLYFLDRDRRPLGPAIFSLDSRAAGIIDGWAAGGVAAEALALTGQVPHASAPSALLAWVQAHQPDRFRQIGHVLACSLCAPSTAG